MEKNKYDFIAELLDNPKLQSNQLKKLVRLAAQEIKSDSIIGTDLEKRIVELEKVIRKNASINQSVTKKNHSPKEMVKFLSEFSRNENLKWFTHKPDLGVDKVNYYQSLQNIDHYLKKITPENLNLSTTSFVENFIKKSKSKLEVFYPKYSLKLTYNNKEVIEHIKNGENPFEIKIDGKHFVDDINRFKTAIEFRTDKPNFKFQKLFKDYISENLSVDFIERYTDDFDKYSNSLTTYIDVNNFFRGIGIIIDWINNNKSLSSEVSINIKNYENYYELSILHKESAIQYTIDNSKLLGLGGDFQTLKKYWFSIVDFYIYADFNSEDKAFKINCLTEDSSMYKDEDSQFKVSKNEISKPLPETINGVKYVIHIYK